MSNIHLLSSVPSFARWPLNLHCFAKEAHAAWGKLIGSAEQPLRASLPILTDFGPATVSEEGEEAAPWGIHALALDYSPHEGVRG